jgi:hypothetical protein
VGFYRITIGSSADEFDLLAEESVVSRQFSTRFISRSILEYLNNTWYRGTIYTSCIIVYGRRTAIGRKILNLLLGIPKLLPFS